jgi:hypothetical protein
VRPAQPPSTHKCILRTNAIGVIDYALRALRGEASFQF